MMGGREMEDKIFTIVAWIAVIGVSTIGVLTIAGFFYKLLNWLWL